MRNQSAPYTFECLPVEAGRFEPFLIDVPDLSGADAAARRAYWTCFYRLGPAGVDVDEFEVFEYDEAAGNPGSGRRVTRSGFDHYSAPAPTGAELVDELEQVISL